MSTLPLPAEHLRYMRRETLLGCVFNAVLSVVFAVLIFRGVEQIPLWGPQGIAVDLVPTVFMITLVGNLIVTFLTRQRVRAGAVPRLIHPTRWPRRALVRMLLLAVVATAVVVPLSIGVLSALGIESMPFAPFVAFKVVYGAVVGALTAPLVIRAALAD